MNAESVKARLKNIAVKDVELCEINLLPIMLIDGLC